MKIKKYIFIIAYILIISTSVYSKKKIKYTAEMIENSIYFKVNDIYGLKSADGDILVDPGATHVKKFNYYRDKDNNLFLFSAVKLKNNNSWTLFYFQDGRLYLSDLYYDTDNIPFSNKMGMKKIAKGKKTKWGFFNINGKIIAEPIYDSVDEFSSGIARVTLNGKYACMDFNGKIISNFKKSIESSSKDRNRIIAAHNKKDKLNTSVKEKVKEKYNFIDKFRDGRAIVWHKYLSTWSKFKNKINIIGIATPYGTGTLWHDDRPTTIYTLIDEDGKALYRSEKSFTFAHGADKLIAIVKEKKWGKSKSGVIDKDGKYVVKCKYDEIYRFYKNLSVVELDNKNGVIDYNGKIIIPVKYEKVYSVGFYIRRNVPETFKYFAVKQNGKWGVMDHKEKWVVENKYKYVSENMPWIYFYNNVGAKQKYLLRLNGLTGEIVEMN